MRPTTIYGVSKVFNELLGDYYSNKFGLDFRSLRYPQVVSSDAPGGGSGDFLIEMFFEGLKHKVYNCFVTENTEMPAIFIDDLIIGTMNFIETDREKLSTSVYNIQGCSIKAGELAEEIRNYIPDLKVNYESDFRQKIVDSWPNSIDDSVAKKDWGWKPFFDLKNMAKTMIDQVKEKI